MSRIWEALKEAQKQRARRQSSASPEPSSAPDSPSSAVSAPEADRRKSERTVTSFSILVYGSDAAHQPFHEQSETLDFTDAGCSLTLETPVAKDQRLFLTNMNNNVETEARVAEVGTRTREKSRVGLKFTHASPHFWSRP